LFTSTLLSPVAHPLHDNLCLFDLTLSSLCLLSLFFLLIPRPPISTLFPYTTLFRSSLTWRPFPCRTGSFCLPGHPLCCWPMQAKDRKSTRLNSSHQIISYAVFCLKKKKQSKRRYKQDKTLY